MANATKKSRPPLCLSPQKGYLQLYDSMQLRSLQGTGLGLQRAAERGNLGWSLYSLPPGAIYTVADPATTPQRTQVPAVYRDKKLRADEDDRLGAKANRQKSSLAATSNVSFGMQQQCKQS